MAYSGHYTTTGNLEIKKTSFSTSFPGPDFSNANDQNLETNLMNKVVHNDGFEMFKELCSENYELLAEIRLLRKLTSHDHLMML